MLIRYPKKLVRPGQWVLAKVPQRARERYSELNRDSVWLAIIPDYAPDDTFKDTWRWWYSLAFRWPESVAAEPPVYYTHKQLWEKAWTLEDGYKSGDRYTYLITYDFDLVCLVHDRRSHNLYDPKEYQLDREGKCGYLYTPASDNPEYCPGPDYSLYQCPKCNEWWEPHSDDNGDLPCPKCDEFPGFFHDAETAGVIERCRELADSIDVLSGGATEHGLTRRQEFERRLNNIAHRTFFGHPARTTIRPDGDYSFFWSTRALIDGEWKNGMCGGLIMHGPHVKPVEGGGYEFTQWDYSQNCNRPATLQEIANISWSTHT